jgi:hypothetical protein
VSRLSIIIPVLGDLQGLEETLLSVLENRPADCQIVVVLNRPYEDPYDLKDEVLFIEAPPGAGLPTVLNLGVAASRAPIIHVLACGVQASPGWTDPVVPLFDDLQVAAVAPLVLEKNDPQRIVTAGLAYYADGSMRRLGRGRLLVSAARQTSDLCGPDCLAAFYRTSALEAAGGFADTVDDRLAVIDTALALRHAGFRCLLEPQCWTYVDVGAIQEPTALQRGRSAERLFWRWAPAAGWSRSLAWHAAMLVGKCLQCLVRPALVAELTGRLLAGLQFTSHRAHWRAIKQQAAGARRASARPHFSARSDVQERPLDSPHQPVNA